ncbi:hypothetical protein [Tenacibaculum maritimum]|uniref:hypothetical protein n=1 Tax=Tenacibaculum maritimum TaxID=107401 RepID=UPI001E3378DE|nr:hypothetical protein [Tenacibaculum maritimum]MCD9609858.1 hypothetical protein [Tenacibaculum maritimum]
MVSIFLKKFGYDCYTTENTIDESESCGKSDIDLRPFIPRQTQMSPDLFGWKSRQQTSCYGASIELLKYGGIKNGGKLGKKIELKNSYGFNDYSNVIQTAIEQNNSIIILDDGTKKAIEYLDQELEKGNPILVGVRHTYKKVKKTKGFKHEQNHDKSTDHFVIIVGRGYENEKRYFLFYEVGTSYSDKGQHDDNRLYINDNWSITGIPQHNLTRTYTLTQIRGNKTNGNFK